jgi:hypothetical protein
MNAQEPSLTTAGNEQLTATTGVILLLPRYSAWTAAGAFVHHH